MEVIIVLLIILLLLAVGAGVLVMTGTVGASTVTSLANRRPARPARLVREARVIDLEPEPTPGRELPPDTVLQLEALSSELRRNAALGDDRLAEVNRQLGTLRDELPARLGDLHAQSAGHWGELAARQAAVEARQTADADRLRMELAHYRVDQERFWGELSRHLAAASNPAAERLAIERATVIAELYGLLAKLETAVAAVTNPMLLPGEPYTPPTELPREALVWENWKEVGDRTFAFADRFSSRRVVLSTAATDELAAYIVELRELLTDAIYPNLRPPATAAQTQMLQQALQTLAVQFQRVRAMLDAEFQAASGQSRQLPPERDAAR